MIDDKKKLRLALDWVQNRLSKKKRRAEQAYINAKRRKVTRNCKHCGDLLGQKVWECQIQAMGTNAFDASICTDLKARYCTEFELPRTLDQFRDEFRQMTPVQLSLRWPAVGELIRVEQLLSSIQGDLTIEDQDEVFPG